MKTKLGELILGDSLEYLKSIPDKSIDLILTDPPFNMTQNEWDIKIDWELFWNEINRIKKNEYTPIVIFGDFPFSVDLINSNRKHYRYTWYIDKGRTTGFLNANRQPLKKIEHLHVFIEKCSKLQYYPQKFKGKPNHSKGKEKEITNNNYGDFNWKESDMSGMKFPTNLLQIQTKHPSKMIHPTEKDLNLMEYLVKTYSEENMTVLDPFMGSGTTAVACEQLNRRWIGIEINEKYYNIAKERLKYIQQTLF